MRLGALVFVFVVGALSAQQAAPVVRVLGRVTNLLGDPVPAAEVWATAKERVVGRTVADGDGNYRLARLAVATDAELVLHARAEGFVERAETIVMRGPVRAALLQLEEGAVLAGTCVRADGTPIAGVCVAAVSVRGSEWIGEWKQEVTTDAQGAWRVAGAPLRPLRVRAWAPGFALANERVERAAEGVRLVLAPTEAEPRIVRVTGMPASGVVEVRCVAWRSEVAGVGDLPSVLRTVVVAADGTAKLWPLPVHHDVQVFAADLVCEPREIACLRNSTMPLAFALVAKPVAPAVARAMLRARVVDDAGKGIAGLRVLALTPAPTELIDGSCFPATQGSDQVAESQTDADGAFAFPASACLLALVSPRFQFESEERTQMGDGKTWVRAADGAVLKAIAACTIRGVLRTSNGQALAGAVVEVSRRVDSDPVGGEFLVHFRDVVVSDGGAGEFTVATDENGRIEIEGVPLGDYTLSVTTAAGRRLRSVRLDCTSGGVDALAPFEIEPVGEARGVVRDAKGEPLAGVLVSLYFVPEDQTQYDEHCFTSVRTDSKGRFRARHLIPGKWRVVRSLEGERFAEPQEIQVQVEAGKVAEVELAPPAAAPAEQPRK